MRCGHVVAFALLGWLASSPAMAITAGEVLDRMSEKEQLGYITGAVDMALYLEQVAVKGATGRSKCILGWFYGPKSSGLRQVLALLEGNRDKTAVGLINIAITRACGRAT